MTENQLYKSGEQTEKTVENERLLTYTQAAECYNLGKGTLKHLVKTGKLRIKKFNARVHRVFESDMKQLSHEQGAA